MTRVALLILPVAAGVIALAAIQHAEARGKAYCRDFAQGVADRDAGATDPSAAQPPGNLPVSMEGAGGDGQSGLAATPADGTSSAVMSDAPPDDRWQEVYHRAYAECRAS